MPAARTAVLLSLLVVPSLGCRAAPRAAVETPWGLARADTPVEATELAMLLADLGPRVRALLPDSRDLEPEVWLEDFSRDRELAERPGVVGLTAVDDGRIRIRADRLGRDADFVLAHELVHALLGPTWDPLPAVLKEGLCDAMASRLAPSSAARVRGIRLFDAGIGTSGLALELVFFEPSRTVRQRLEIPLAATGRIVPAEALRIPGRGIHLHDDFGDASALYGIGLVVTERIVERIGFDGLHALCLRAREAGAGVVPAGWLLAAAELGPGDDDAVWRAALLERIGEDELLAQCGYLSEQLAVFLATGVGSLFPAWNGEAFLDRALPTLGWVGGEVRVALGTVPELRTRLAERWEAAPVAGLRTGDGWWVRRGELFELTSLLPPGQGETWFTIARLTMSGELTPERTGPGLPLDDAAGVVALVHLGRDAGGAFVRSTLPGGFDGFRVEVEGRLVSDLATGHNATLATDARGWTTVTARLADDGPRFRELVLYPDRPNLVVSQRGARRGDAPVEQRFPLWAR